jgi:hypothetical protein
MARTALARFLRSPRVISLAFLILITITGKPAWGGTIRGVFALGNPNRPTPSAIFNNPNVDGIALRYFWNAIEPSEHQFNWAPIDAELAQAAAHHKLVSLGVTTGIFTPDWVYGAGAAQFSFRWDKPWGPPPCSTVRMPLPWDPIYLSKWLNFVREMGQRYGKNSALVSVKIEGINAQTEELLLPHSHPGQKNASKLVNCQPGDDVSEWQSVGYTATKIKETWRAIARTYLEAFPTQALVLQAGPWGMPPIDDTGSLIPKRDSNTQLAPEVIAIGNELIGGRFVVQNNGLQANWDWPQLREVAGSANVAFQTAWRVTNDSSCRMNHFERPCDPHTMLELAVNRGIDDGAIYLELYTDDLLNPRLDGVIANGHARFAGRQTRY